MPPREDLVRVFCRPTSTPPARLPSPVSSPPPSCRCRYPPPLLPSHRRSPAPLVLPPPQARWSTRTSCSYWPQSRRPLLPVRPQRGHVRSRNRRQEAYIGVGPPAAHRPASVVRCLSIVRPALLFAEVKGASAAALTAFSSPAVAVLCATSKAAWATRMGRSTEQCAGERSSHGAPPPRRPGPGEYGRRGPDRGLMTRLRSESSPSYLPAMRWGKS